MRHIHIRNVTEQNLLSIYNLVEKIILSTFTFDTIRKVNEIQLVFY